jgi:hypothetical protein
MYVYIYMYICVYMYTYIQHDMSFYRCKFTTIKRDKRSIFSTHTNIYTNICIYIGPERVNSTNGILTADECAAGCCQVYIYLSVCVYIYIYNCKRMYICTYIYTHLFMYIFICIHIYMYICIYMYVPTHMCI